MPGEITVRPAEAGDLNELLRLFEQLNAENVRTETVAHAPDVLAAIIAQPDRHLMVAIIGGEVVGTADLLVAANLTHAARPWALIENIVVDEANRGRGVGATLLGALVEIARAAGCYRIVLTSDKDRQDAHEFYRRTGWKPVAEGFKFFLDDELSSSDL